MDDRRSGPRRRVLLAGKVMLPGGGAIDCTLRNRSARGVRLRVESVVGIPDRFRLLVEATGEVLEAEVQWRTATECGVRLV